jgi:hypothetical protein
MERQAGDRSARISAGDFGIWIVPVYVSHMFHVHHLFFLGNFNLQQKSRPGISGTTR